jgi:hypothetical protein
MVRAILAGDKTVTRRIVLPQPPENMWYSVLDGNASVFFNENNEEDCDWWPEDAAIKCPYGKKGDLLWVRETFCKPQLHPLAPTPSWIEPGKIYYYRSDYSGGDVPELKWKPSIHMPRCASRLMLEVTDVRVERVQEITEEDARAEGLKINRYGVWHWNDESGVGGKGARQTFEILWDLINKKRGYGWDANPWVWVGAFTIKNV